MKKQCYLVAVSGYHGRVLTHVNKCKKYPYASLRQGYAAPGFSYKAKMKTQIVASEINDVRI